MPIFIWLPSHSFNILRDDFKKTSFTHVDFELLSCISFTVKAIPVFFHPVTILIVFDFQIKKVPLKIYRGKMLMIFRP
jgi:hypothetical protein